MPPALSDPLSATPASSDAVSRRSAAENRRFGYLRGLQWRMNLGVLPSSSSTSIDDLRRVTANCRRRYASLRRRLLVEPHVPKDGTNSPNHEIDNPLSQNPDSTWSRFFRNAELERMVDQDLSRLYPEHGSFFQTPGCQSMLRRILLLWCLRHPECGYRQGMHELLAPLLYVLQFDLEHLSEVRKLYEDHFTDRFDGLLCQENDLSYSFDFKKSPELMEDEFGSHGNAVKVNSLDELDPKIQTIVLLSDAYGAEGELGIVLSEKFVEHDAYCMFDALMIGGHGSVAMANFFSSSPVSGSHSGLPPVIEASTALYYLLSLVDSSLHSHLFDLGVEPQYFSLRWLRVLFGREFSLANLLIIWDEIFASENSSIEKGADDCEFQILNSPRGAFISAIAVAMLLHLRSSLLATENPTKCLQRLLNFPADINIEKLLEKAKSLQDLALSVDISSSSLLFIGSCHQTKSMFARSVTLPSESVSPKTPLNLLPDSYWEEKWRVAQKAEELKQDALEKQVPTRKRGWTEKVKFSLRRAESGPPLSRIQGGKNFRRSLLEDLRKALGSEEDAKQMQQDETLCQHDNLSEAVEVQQEDSGGNGDNNFSSDDRSASGNSGSEEDLSIFSDPTSPPNEANDHEIISEKISVASNVSSDEGNETSGTSSSFPISDPPENISQTSQCNTENSECSETSDTSPNDSLLPISDPPENISQTGNSECNETSDTSPNDPPLPISDPCENIPPKSGCNNDNAGSTATSPKEKKPNKLQWFWPFGRNNVEVVSEKVGVAAEAANRGSTQNNTPQPAPATANEHGSSVSYRGESVDQNVMGTLKNIGQSMLDHIQVIESVFQQDRKGQVTAMTALKELRKISNLLSEM
ncbi:TBC1 domain family member 5-like A [Mucuna pruriens]|uniref:TBC1 domain family member 5-like A n=1 Tax=Mucuna pruriens TaxID=157652 RepID=A0A371FUR7_MUCPR|nr:TBC1 domain family member 5-like A [Mucuna pruriens]